MPAEGRGCCVRGTDDDYACVTPELVVSAIVLGANRRPDSVRVRSS
ncbi:hypothetical protein [Streptomyces werraensis]